MVEDETVRMTKEGAFLYVGNESFSFRVCETFWVYVYMVVDSYFL